MYLCHTHVCARTHTFLRARSMLMRSRSRSRTHASVPLHSCSRALMHARAHARALMHMRAHLHVSSCTCELMHTRAHAHTRTCSHMHMLTHMHACTCTHTHTRSCTRSCTHARSCARSCTRALMRTDVTQITSADLYDTKTSCKVVFSIVYTTVVAGRASFRKNERSERIRGAGGQRAEAM